MQQYDKTKQNKIFTVNTGSSVTRAARSKVITFVWNVPQGVTAINSVITFKEKTAPDLEVSEIYLHMCIIMKNKVFCAIKNNIMCPITQPPTSAPAEVLRL